MAPALFLVYLFIGFLGFIRDHLPTHFLNIYFRGINNRSMVRRGAEYYQDLDISKGKKRRKTRHTLEPCNARLDK